MIKITPQELTRFADYIHEHCGIVLNQSKAYLLESRLAPLLEESGKESFTDLFNLINGSPPWTNRVVDAITTNETSFFRDQRPFELFRYKILPDLFDTLGAQRRLNVWSAACSTGQEVYTLAMVICELLGRKAESWNIKITGTDIADSAIVKSSMGVYTKYEVERGVPPSLLDKYFQTHGEAYKIRDELRAMAFFKKFNLLTAQDNLGIFDVIFCRNVAIYFSQENRRRLFAQIATRLRPGGTLIIGSTESLIGVSDRFLRQEHHNTIYYQLKSD